MNADCSVRVLGNEATEVNKRQWWAGTRVQLILLALCNFCSIGMWNSLNGLGGLGTGDEKMAHYCNSCSYIVGIFGGFISGSVVNCLGIRTSVGLGCLAMTLELFGYFLYYYVGAIPLWGTVLINGFTGIVISWMTSAIGAGLVHYPTESQRNKYIAVASAILNVGGLIGGLISLAMNANAHSTHVALSRQSYLTIILLSGLGIIFASLLAPSEKIVRSDGTRPAIPKRSPMLEIRDLFCAFGSLNLYLLVPLFSCNVWHEVVLFNYFNSTLFNVRSRAFNTICYYLARVASSFIFQAACDAFSKIHHRVLSAILTVACFVIVAGICGTIIFSGSYGIRDQTEMDFTEPKAITVIIAFFAYGSLETMASSFSFWLIGILPLGDTPVKNRYIGALRMFVNLGGATSWLLDVNHHVSYLSQWILTSILWVSALIGVWLVTLRTTKTAAIAAESAAPKATITIDEHEDETVPETPAAVKKLNKKLSSSGEELFDSYDSRKDLEFTREDHSIDFPTVEGSR